MQCTHSKLSHTQNSTILKCKQLTNSNDIQACTLKCYDIQM